MPQKSAPKNKEIALNNNEVLFYISKRAKLNCITPEVFSLIENYCQKRKIAKKHIILAKRLKDDDIKGKILSGKYKKIYKIVKRRGFGLLIIPDKNYCWLASLAASDDFKI